MATARIFEYRHITVPRTARYAIMGSFDSALTEVWIVCHGHGQLAGRFLSRFTSLERDDRLFIAPEALSRYYLGAPNAVHRPDTPVGATWMTREDREAEIEDYIKYLDRIHDEIFAQVDRKKIRLWVLGFSQGVATIMRWLARGKVTADRAVMWAGMIPPELDASGARALATRAPVTLVVGDSDEFATPKIVAAQEARLHELGVPYTKIGFVGGHDISDSALTALAESDA